MKAVLRTFAWFFALLSFSSCNEVEVILERVPEDTPPNEPIYLSGSFNNWAEGDERYRFHSLSDGRMGLFLPMMQGTIDCKVTRGSWLTVEADSCGQDIPNRQFSINGNDQIRIEVENWKDRSAALCDFVEVIVDAEGELDEYEELYLCGSHNDWKLYDPLYRLRPQGNGRFSGRLPRRNEPIQFKVNRGDWSSVEVEEDGTSMESRILLPDDPDSLYVVVSAWNDLVAERCPTLTVVIEHMPPIPNNAELFLASNLNGWDPAAPNYRFEFSDQLNKHILTLPRRGEQFFFKITQGNWATVETESNGILDIENREWEFGLQDTLRITIDGWKLPN